MARARWRRDPAKERFWRKAVRGWQRSGLSIRAYCAGNQLSENNFHAWRREIARRDQEKGRGRTNQRRHRGRSRRAKPIARENLFVPVRVTSNLSCGAIEIVLSSSRTVRVVAGFDRLALRDVIATLEALPC